MLAEVVFDLPVGRPFTYAIPSHLVVAPGQRVLAPLGSAVRPGVVVALVEGEARGVKLLTAALEPRPILGRAQLDLVRWIAAESCSSLGSTCAALLPPALPTEAMAAAPEG